MVFSSGACEPVIISFNCCRLNWESLLSSINLNISSIASSTTTTDCLGALFFDCICNTLKQSSWYRASTAVKSITLEILVRIVRSWSSLRSFTRLRTVQFKETETATHLLIWFSFGMLWVTLHFWPDLLLHCIKSSYSSTRIPRKHFSLVFFFGGL